MEKGEKLKDLINKLGWVLLLLTFLFKLRLLVLSKTLSHIWGKLNLPMLLFKVGLLTLI